MMMFDVRGPGPFFTRRLRRWFERRNRTLQIQNLLLARQLFDESRSRLAAEALAEHEKLFGPIDWEALLNDWDQK